MSIQDEVMSEDHTLDGYWYCEDCGSCNGPSRTECKQCGLEKPLLLLVPLVTSKCGVRGNTLIEDFTRQLRGISRTVTPVTPKSNLGEIYNGR